MVDFICPNSDSFKYLSLTLLFGWIQLKKEDILENILTTLIQFLENQKNLISE